MARATLPEGARLGMRAFLSKQCKRLHPEIDWEEETMYQCAVCFMPIPEGSADLVIVDEQPVHAGECEAELFVRIRLALAREMVAV